MTLKTKIEKQYFEYNNQKADLVNPVLLSEKLCARKLIKPPRLVINSTDKLMVRDYIQKVIGEPYLPKLYMTSDYTDVIDEKHIRNPQFVVKTNHDSGGVVICRNPREFDWKRAREKLSAHIMRDYYEVYYEPQYRSIEKRILVEEYICDVSSETGVPNEYKFYCFDGVPALIKYDGIFHQKKRTSFLDITWKKLELKYNDRRKLDLKPMRPSRLDEMIEISRELSKPFKFVRVDLYEASGKVFFGEFNFSPAGGYKTLNPLNYEREFGEMLTFSGRYW